MKTPWQKVYSFFGFWTYTHHFENGRAHRVLYWCCFPFFFIRKFDVFSWEVTRTQGREAMRRQYLELERRMDDEEAASTL